MASYFRRLVLCLQPSPFEGGVGILSADSQPIVRHEQPWSGASFPFARRTASRHPRIFDSLWVRLAFPGCRLLPIPRLGWHGRYASPPLSGVGRGRAFLAPCIPYRAALTGFHPADRSWPGAHAAPPKVCVVGPLGHHPQSSSRMPSSFRSERRRSILRSVPCLRQDGIGQVKRQSPFFF